MEKEFIPYELAVKLKALGFDEPCFVFWTNTPKYKGDNVQLCVTDGSHGHHPNSILFKQDFLKEGEVLAPTFSQAFRWFRENHKLNFECKTPDGKAGKWFPGIHKVYGFGNMFDNDGFATYEEAELACIEKLIELTFKSE